MDRDLDDLSVNLADPDDIRAKLPRARAILQRKEDEFEVEQERVVAQMADLAAKRDTWRQLVDSLSHLAGVTPPERAWAPDHVPAMGSTTATATAPTGLAPQELVVEVVNREVRPIRARDVRAILAQEGHDLGGDAVSNALWYAAFRSKPSPLIRQIKRGWYAPLAYKVEEMSAPDDGGAS